MELTAAASAADAGIHKKYQSLQKHNYSGLSIKGVTQSIENETKEQRGGFLGMLLGTRGASL